MADKQYIIRIGSDNVLELSGVKDAVTDAYIDSGSGAGVLKDSLGATVTGAGALTLTNVDGSTTGNWYVTITDTIAATLTEDSTYTLETTLTDDSGNVVLLTTRYIAKKYYGED